MTIYRYSAVPLDQAQNGQRERGELAAGTAAEARAALRRVGLQVVDMKPLGSPARRRASARAQSDRQTEAPWHRHLRRRRRAVRAELYDSLGTLLASGVPMLEAVETIARGARPRTRAMLLRACESLRGGASLGEAARAHPGWFGPAEVAMIEAGQRSGTLSAILGSLADQEGHGHEVEQRIVSVLSYPAIVTLVGLVVVVFLSTRTLPDLVEILSGSGIETPVLTARVMAVGSFLAHWWPALIGACALLGCMLLFGPHVLGRVGLKLPGVAPRFLRRLAVGRFAHELAQLLRAGVPMVEGLRVLAPTAPGGFLPLEGALHRAAQEIERGASLSSAFDDERLFDAEFKRLLEVGQASGELDRLLVRIGERYQRQSKRLIERLASILEPSVILVLAALVGLVVMAAVLPLLKLQEMV